MRAIAGKDEEVICLDNFLTGRRRNVAHLLDHPNFELIRHDVVDPLKAELIEFTIWHVQILAHYQYNPIKTVKTR